MLRDYHDDRVRPGPAPVLEMRSEYAELDQSGFCEEGDRVHQTTSDAPVATAGAEDTGSIYEAAIAVFMQRSFRDFGHAEVAERAGVDITMVMRRWPNKAELLIDALAGAAGPLPVYHGESLRDGLLDVVTKLADLYATHGDLMAAVLYQLREHPDLDQAFRERYLLPRLACARKLFGTAVLREQLRPDADPRLILSLVPALMTYRTLVHDPVPDPGAAERLVDLIMLPLLLREPSGARG